MINENILEDMQSSSTVAIECLARYLNVSYRARDLQRNTRGVARSAEEVSKPQGGGKLSQTHFVKRPYACHISFLFIPGTRAIANDSPLMFCIHEARCVKEREVGKLTLLHGDLEHVTFWKRAVIQYIYIFLT